MDRDKNIEILAPIITDAIEDGEDNGAYFARLALSALEVAGLVVVPMEPDDHMRQTGADASRSTIIDTDGSKHAVSISADSAGAVYCAMISAALGEKEGDSQ